MATIWFYGQGICRVEGSHMAENHNNVTIAQTTIDPVLALELNDKQLLHQTHSNLATTHYISQLPTNSQPQQSGTMMALCLIVALDLKDPINY